MKKTSGRYVCMCACKVTPFPSVAHLSGGMEPSSLRSIPPVYSHKLFNSHRKGFPLSLSLQMESNSSAV